MLNPRGFRPRKHHLSTRFDANILPTLAFLPTRRLRILRARRAADALNLRALVLDQTREVQRARAVAPRAARVASPKPRRARVRRFRRTLWRPRFAESSCPPRAPSPAPPRRRRRTRRASRSPPCLSPRRRRPPRTPAPRRFFLGWPRGNLRNRRRRRRDTPARHRRSRLVSSSSRDSVIPSIPSFTIVSSRVAVARTSKRAASRRRLGFRGASLAEARVVAAQRANVPRGPARRRRRRLGRRARATPYATGTRPSIRDVPLERAVLPLAFRSAAKNSSAAPNSPAAPAVTAARETRFYFYAEGGSFPE